MSSKPGPARTNRMLDSTGSGVPNNLLLFDNKGNAGRSKVIEFDPLTQTIDWTYGTDDDELLYSAMCGASERLPNGNTLITESFNGRALEVNPAGEIVWQFVSPHRTGAENELVAVLTEMTRLPLSFSIDWADPVLE